MKKKEEECRCSLCGRSSKEIPVLPGVDGGICVECVEQAHQLIMERAPEEVKARAGIGKKASSDVPPEWTGAGWEMGKGRTEGGLARIDGGFVI